MLCVSATACTRYNNRLRVNGAIIPQVSTAIHNNSIIYTSVSIVYGSTFIIRLYRTVFNYSTPSFHAYIIYIYIT